MISAVYLDPKPTHCAACSAAFVRWAMLDKTLIPYEAHPRGTLALEKAPLGSQNLDRLLRIRDTAGLGWKKNDPSKFKTLFEGERFVSHYSVCPSYSMATGGAPQVNP